MAMRIHISSLGFRMILLACVICAWTGFWFFFVQRYTVIDEKWSNNTNTTLTAQDQKLEQFLLERE